MATETTNLKLHKPATSEKYDVLKQNQNWDKIDNAFGMLNSKLTPIVDELTDVVTPSRRDMAKYSVSGNMCTIHINNVSFSESFSQDTVAFSCPYKPAMSTRFIMYDQEKNVIPCYINLAGDIMINGYTGGKLLYGSVTFVCIRN